MPFFVGSNLLKTLLISGRFFCISCNQECISNAISQLNNTKFSPRLVKINFFPFKFELSNLSLIKFTKLKVSSVNLMMSFLLKSKSDIFNFSIFILS